MGHKLARYAAASNSSQISSCLIRQPGFSTWRTSLIPVCVMNVLSAPSANRCKFDLSRGCTMNFSSFSGRSLRAPRSVYFHVLVAPLSACTTGDDEDKGPLDSSDASGPKKTVKIFCSKCKELLYKYRKGGNGALVKCFVERIAEDFTFGDMKCHGCGTEFARARIIKGKPAHKIIGGKVFMRK